MYRGNGVVIDPRSLVGELDQLKAQRVNVKGRLFISERAHLVLPHHELERCAERLKGKCDWHHLAGNWPGVW